MVPVKRDLKSDKAKLINSLPLRYENVRATARFESKTQPRQNFSKPTPPIDVEKKSSTQTIKDPKKDTQVELTTPQRSVPIAGTKIIRETYLSSDEGSEPEQVYEINDKTTKIAPKIGTQNHIQPRSKSTVLQQQKNTFSEDRIPKEKTRLTNTNPPKTNTDLTRDSFDYMLESVIKKKDIEESKVTESRRVTETESSLAITTIGIDTPTKKKGNLTKLIGKHMEGEEEFFEGTLIRGLKSGFCRVLYSSYLFKEGFFMNGQLEGEGSLKFPNGVTITGIFKNGNLQSNIVLSIENEIFSIDYLDGEYHNDQIFVNEKGLLSITIKPCENINDYTGKIRIYFRNFYKLDASYEKGVLSETFESTLYDKLDNPLLGRVRHGINAETNGIFIFRPTADPENEYLMLFKGECKVVRKHKK